MALIIDVFGAPDSAAALEAAAHASAELDVDLQLVGHENTLAGALAELPCDFERISVDHYAGDSIDEALDQALRLTAMRPSTLICSANPRGLIDAAHRHLALIDGVERAALAGVYPTLRHRGHERDPFALLLDVSASVEPRARDLVVWAALGAEYARIVSRNDQPIVALLANSSQRSLCSAAVRRAAVGLDEVELDWDYRGLITADQVPAGDADVVVAGGLAGDVMLRSIEGLATTGEALVEQARRRFRWRVGVQMLSSAIERLREMTDWENYGGAPVLGFDRSVILIRQDAGTRAWYNAIRLARKLDRGDLIGRLRVAAAAAGGHP